MNFTSDYREAILNSSNEKHFNSSFKFLNNQNGLRRNKIHTFIAPTHSGKSTFFRSILTDVLNNNPESKIVIYLSEDDRNSFLVDLARSSIKDDDINNRLKIFYEMDSKLTHYKSDDLFKNLKEICDEFNPDVFIFDNITTSLAYMDISTREQGFICQRLKKFTEHYGCATIIFAHTGANVFQGGLVDVNNVRGSKHISNISHFMYAIQQISYFSRSMQADRKTTVLIVKKHRGASVDYNIFSFNYDSKTSCYSQDMAINFEDFKAIFDKRNKLWTSLK